MSETQNIAILTRYNGYQKQPDGYADAKEKLEQGVGMAELLKAVKYDAMTPGNHDWHYGKDRLKELQKLSKVPILAGNVTEADSAFFANDGTLMKTVDGVKIGVIGVFDPVLKNSTAPRNVEGLTFADDAEKASELKTITGTRL